MAILRFNTLILVVYFHKFSLVKTPSLKCRGQVFLIICLPPPQLAPFWPPPWKDHSLVFGLLSSGSQVHLRPHFLKKAAEVGLWLNCSSSICIWRSKVCCLRKPAWRCVSCCRHCLAGFFQNGSVRWQITGRKTLIALCIFSYVSELFQWY